MAKPLSKEDKELLLSYRQESLTVPVITKLFSKHAIRENGKFQIMPPKFNVQSPFHLFAKEYINEKDVDTTVGSFLFNKLFVEGMLEPVIENGYFNEVVNKKGFGKLTDAISNGVMMGKISVEPTLIRWLKYYEFYSLKLSTLFSASYTEGMIKQNLSVVKEKERLLKTRKIESPKDMTDIEDELVAKSHDILKNDPAITLFDSGARGSFDNDYKNMNIMVGPVATPGKDEFTLMKSNYITGIQKEDIVAAANSLVNAAYPKAVIISAA